MTILKLVYEQTIIADASDQLVEMRPGTHLELGYEAIQRNWFKRLAPNWIDLAILLSVGLHARPLIGADLQLLMDFGLATINDAGRLYARVTDVGLADILTCHRDTVRHAAERLNARGLLRTVDLPPNFRDSRGTFAGNTAYLLTGQVLTSPNHRAGLAGTVDSNRAGLAGTVRPSRAGLAGTKNLTMSFTPPGGGGATSLAPAAGDLGETTPVLDDADGTDEFTSKPSGNGQAAHHGQAAIDAAAGQQAHRLLRMIWDRLEQAVQTSKARQDCLELLERVEAKFGFAEAGFRAAKLSLEPLPDRRRRVLSDMRRMSGRSDLSAAVRKRNTIGLLTQNIGVTIGLGLLGDGSLRMMADKADYTAIGGLIDEYGAETVWQTACEMAGQAFEGDPLLYLRGVLRNKRERAAAGGTARAAAGLGRFEQLDYVGQEVGVEGV